MLLPPGPIITLLRCFKTPGRLRARLECMRCVHGGCEGGRCIMVRMIMSSRLAMGTLLAALTLLLLTLKLYVGGRTTRNLPVVVADYEDHFAIDVAMGVEGSYLGWRSAACSFRASTPPFPIRLPKFNASSSDKNIFFLETTCASALNAKMACAIESVAIHHPDHKVHLALTSSHVSGTDAIIQALVAHDNVHISTLDIDHSLEDTDPLGKWLREMEWARGTEWASINLSDALRLGVVCSTGGTYLDLDIWTVAPLPSGQTWIGREKWEHVSNGAFRIPKDHWLCEAAVRELTENFRGDIWGHNGPGVFQRIIKNTCGVSNISDVQQCKDLVILAPATFYPLYWKRWEELFVIGGSNSWTWPQETVGIHLWNKFSKDAPLHPGDGSIVDRTAKKNCPKVYGTVRQIRKLREHLQKKKARNQVSAFGYGK